MLKNMAQLEHIIENKIFHFVCENDAPLHFVKEALFQFQKYIGQIEDMAKQQEAQKVQQQENKAEPIPEVKDVKPGA
jgi:hypothetical protein